MASLPAEVPQATGEEDETTVFSGDGVLFEFDASKQWRERGSGEMRVNLGKESKQVGAGVGAVALQGRLRKWAGLIH